MPKTDRKGRVALLPEEALAVGWRSWVVLLAVASCGFLAALSSRALLGEPGSAALGAAGAVVIGVALAWLVLLGGVVLLLRSYCFRALWDGRPVEPGSYLKGMYQVWGVLVVGALLAVLGSLLMRAMLPGGLVVLGALLLLVFARPRRRALGL